MNISKSCIYSLIMWSLIVNQVLAQQKTLDKSAQIGALLKKYNRTAGFNGAVLVAQNNRIIWKGGVGFAERKTKLKNTAQTQFLVGSVSKQFTSMLIMQLVQEGKIKLTDYAKKYLPFLPKEKSKITIHHLLSHTSGLMHYSGLHPRFSSFQYKKLTPLEYAKIIAQMKMHALPGTKMRYSSMGYILLAVIAENVTGKSFSTLLQERIVRPLGLKHTGFTYQTEQLTNFAISYERSGSSGTFKYVRNRPRSQTNTYSTGGVHSSVEDLFTWLKSFQTNKLLNARLRQRLFTPNLNNYAYGWVISDPRLKKEGFKAPKWSHTGSVNDYRAIVTVFDDSKEIIIILSNAVPVKIINILTELKRVLANK